MPPSEPIVPHSAHVVFALVRGDGLGVFVERSRCVRRALASSSAFDQVAFHEGNVPTAAQQAVSAQVPALRFFDARDFGGFNAPPNTTLSADGYSIGYHHMCRFMSLLWFKALARYDFAMRVDEDVCLQRFEADPFERMRASALIYGYGLKTRELHEGTLQTMPKWVQTYAAERHLDASRLTTDEIYFSNFFVSNVSWWSSDEVQAFLSAVDESGNIYSNRWGDAPVQTAALSLFSAKTSAVHLPTDYLHLSTMDIVRSDGASMPLGNDANAVHHPLTAAFFRRQLQPSGGPPVQSNATAAASALAPLNASACGGNGTLSNGTLSNGTLSNGTLANGTATNATATNCTVGVPLIFQVIVSLIVGVEGADAVLNISVVAEMKDAFAAAALVPSSDVSVTTAAAERFLSRGVRRRQLQSAHRRQLHSAHRRQLQSAARSEPRPNSTQNESFALRATVSIRLPTEAEAQSALASLSTALDSADAATAFLQRAGVRVLAPPSLQVRTTTAAATPPPSSAPSPFPPASPPTPPSPPPDKPKDEPAEDDILNLLTGLGVLSGFFVIGWSAFELGLHLNRQNRQPHANKLVKQQLALGCVAFVVGMGLIVVVPIFVSGGLPSTFVLLLQDGQVIDTQKKFDDGPGKLAVTIQSHCVFSVTNAFELQTISPAPTPRLVEICISLRKRTQAFDFALSSDELEYSAKTWTYYEAVNESEMDQSIVSINQLLLLTMYASGNESALLAAGGASEYAGLHGLATIDASSLKPDGTGSLNAGLFMRYTLREFLDTGYDLLGSHVPLLLNPERAEWIYPTLASLQAALASGAENPLKWSYTKKTGKFDPALVGRLGAVKGTRELVLPAGSGDANWGLAMPGWDNSGRAAAAPDGKFVIDGLRSLHEHPALPAWPAALTSTELTLPSFGSSFVAFDEGRLREVEYVCADECLNELLHNTVAVKKFEMAERVSALYSNGVELENRTTCLDQLCDHAMKYRGVQNLEHAFGFPMAITSRYFGNCSDEIVNSFEIVDLEGRRLNYSHETMSEAMWIEPLTGAALQIRISVQINFMVSRSYMDGSLYANVFSGEGDNGDAFVWPLKLLKEEYASDAADCRGIAKLGWISALLASVFIGVNALAACVWLPLSCAYLYSALNKVRRNRREASKETAGKDEKQQKKQKTQERMPLRKRSRVAPHNDADDAKTNGSKYKATNATDAASEGGSSANASPSKISLWRARFARTPEA